MRFIGLHDKQAMGATKCFHKNHNANPKGEKFPYGPRVHYLIYIYLVVKQASKF